MTTVIVIPYAVNMRSHIYMPNRWTSVLVTTVSEPEAFMKRQERLFTVPVPGRRRPCPYSCLSILAILSPVMSANGRSALSHGEQPVEYAGATGGGCSGRHARRRG